MLFKASAPGSLMLLGEYAVLQGKPALVCAVDKRMTVYLKPRADQVISVSSSLGQFSCELSRLVIQPPFQFVLSACQRFKKFFKTGCDIQIESEFSSEVGLGSSAAVTVATLAVLSKWLNKKMDSMKLIREARFVVREVQGLGSGADVAACVLGGVVFYQAQPLVAKSFSADFPLTVIYSGSKTPTVEAVRFVEKLFKKRPKLFQSICRGIQACTSTAIGSVRKKNWLELGYMMNVQQGFMEALGVNTPQLNEIIQALRKQPGMLGVKISGSGLGDCVIGLGIVATVPSYQSLAVKLSMRGVECEKN